MWVLRFERPLMSKLFQCFELDCGYHLMMLCMLKWWGLFECLLWSNPETEVKLQTWAVKKCEKGYTNLCISAFIVLYNSTEKRVNVGNKLFRKSCEVEHTHVLWGLPKIEPKWNANLSLQENFCDQGSAYNYLYVTETVCGIVIDDWHSTENSL
jgi:hypothetical protein